MLCGLAFGGSSKWPSISSPSARQLGRNRRVRLETQGFLRRPYYSRSGMAGFCVFGRFSPLHMGELETNTSLCPFRNKRFWRFRSKNLPWPKPGVWPALGTLSPQGLQTDTPFLASRAHFLAGAGLFVVFLCALTGGTDSKHGACFAGLQRFLIAAYLLWGFTQGARKMQLMFSAVFSLGLVSVLRRSQRDHQMAPPFFLTPGRRPAYATVP